MYDGVIFEKGNRKVVGTVVDERGRYHNVLSFYEGDKEVLYTKLYSQNFHEFNSKQVKKLSGYSFIDIFLENGIEDMTINEIKDAFREKGRNSWTKLISFTNGMEYEDIVHGQENLLFLFRDEVCEARLSDLNITYREVSNLNVSDILNYVRNVSIPSLKQVHIGNDIYLIKAYDMEIPINWYVRNCIDSIENLKKMDYFNTGCLFKIEDGIKPRLAKIKLLTGKFPMLLAIDSEGYAIFDRVPYMK